MAVIGLDPIGLTVAFAAGALSFLSPCLLPLVPGYVAFMAAGSDSKNARLRRVGFFVLGFALIFTLLGLGSGFAGGFFLKERRTFEIVGGVLIILLGLFMILPRLSSTLQREKRMRLKQPSSDLAASGVGMAFAVGWSPCIGPSLAAILALAATSGSTFSGGALLFVFALGLGLPFLLITLFMDRAERLMSRLRLHTQVARVAAGGMMVVFGVLLAAGTLGRLSAQLSGINPPINI